jgi:HK97 family phage major capsid protein
LAGRSLNTGTGSAGEFTVTSRHNGDLIESLRPYSAAIDAGAIFITGLKQGNLVLPRISSGLSMRWGGENENAPRIDPVFDNVVIIPRTLSVTLN